jgi:DNA-binding SARP family transcriptional activator
VRSDVHEPVILERRDAALLALLGVDGPTSRHRVLALLWPDETPDRVRGRLRQRLYALNRRLGFEAVSGQRVLALNPGLQWPGPASEPEAIPLGDDDYGDLPEFAEWLRAWRTRHQAVVRERIADETSRLEQQGRFAEAIVVAERLLAIEPLQEHGHRRLMRLHYLRGDRAAALRVFDRCEQLLKDELSARPSAETLDLLARIEEAREPVLATAPRPVPASVLRPPRLIGRDAEWARLQAAWAAGGAVIVVGEAGMGKTRLIDDMVHAQPAGPAAALQVSARPGDARVPYALIVRLLRALLERRGPAPLPEGLEAEFARLLPELPQRPNGTGTGTGTAISRPRLVRAIEHTLREATEAGLQTVVLDDLHFADPASLELAQPLCSAPAPRWVVAFRGAELGDAGRTLLDALARARHAEQLVLPPLDVGQVVELVDSLGLHAPDAAALGVALHRRTGGNPLFLLETLKALVRSDGALQGSPDLLALARLPAGSSVGRLIAHRLGQLSRDAVALARCAAIAGQDFTPALAARILQQPAITLADAWAELEAAQVIRQDGFAHDLIQEAALASVPPSIAKQLHGEVAAWLSEQAGEAARVAQHWQQAGCPGPAARAWLEAAQRCATHGRRAEQSQLLERAAQAFGQAGDREGRCEALLRRAEVIGQHSDLEAALRAIDAAAAGVDSEPDRLRLAVIELTTRGFHGQDDHTLSRGFDVLAMARRLARPEEAFFAALVIGGALSRAARVPEALALLAEQRPWVDARATADQRREYWNAVALALDYGSRMRESMQAWQTTREWAQRSGSDLLCQVIGNMAYTSAKMGDVREAAALGEQALQRARHLSDGYDHQVLEQQLALGHHLRNLGCYARALEMLEAARAGFRAGGRDLRARTAGCFLATAWVQLGQPARALPLTDVHEPAPPSRVEAMRLAFRALALQACDQEAAGPLRQALALLDEPESIWFRTHCLIATAILPPDEAEPMALDLVSWALARERFGLALAAHARAARCALALGAPQRALPHLEAACGLAASNQPDVFYLPELWWVAAQVHAARGQEAGRRQAIEAGAAWVRRVAHAHVPPALQDSFLRRNRINADLLAWARALDAQAGVPAGMPAGEPAVGPGVAL